MLLGLSVLKEISCSVRSVQGSASDSRWNTSI